MSDKTSDTTQAGPIIGSAFYLIQQVKHFIKNLIIAFAVLFGISMVFRL